MNRHLEYLSYKKQNILIDQLNNQYIIIVIPSNVCCWFIKINKNLIKTQYDSYIKPRQDWIEKQKFTIMFVGLRCECDAKKNIVKLSLYWNKLLDDQSAVKIIVKARALGHLNYLRVN